MAREQVSERALTSQVPRGTKWGKLNDYYELTKPRIVMLMLITGYTTLWMATGTVPPLGLTLVTLVGTALSAGSANALNCYIDRDIDGIMRRTRNRPIPSGRLTPSEALWFGIITGIVAVALLAWLANPLAAFWAAFGILFYVFIYTLWLKRSTPQNIVIGGAAGSVPPLIAWAAATGTVTWPAIVLFLVIFLWTPPHFWALALFASEDYEKVNVPMLPNVHGVDATNKQIIVYTVLLTIVSLLLTPLGATGWLYFAAAALAGIYFIILAVRSAQAKDDDYRAAKKLFFYSILYLAIVFGAMVIDRQ